MTVRLQKMTTATESRRALGSSYSFAYPDAGLGDSTGAGNGATTAPTFFPLRSLNPPPFSFRRRQKLNLQPRWCMIHNMLHIFTSFHYDHVVRLLLSFFTSQIYPRSIDGEGGTDPLMENS